MYSNMQPNIRIQKVCHLIEKHLTIWKSQSYSAKKLYTFSKKLLNKKSFSPEDDLDIV